MVVQGLVFSCLQWLYKFLCCWVLRGSSGSPVGWLPHSNTRVSHEVRPGTSKAAQTSAGSVKVNFWVTQISNMKRTWQGELWKGNLQCCPHEACSACPIGPALVPHPIQTPCLREVNPCHGFLHSLRLSLQQP